MALDLSWHFLNYKHCCQIWLEGLCLTQWFVWTQKLVIPVYIFLFWSLLFCVSLIFLHSVTTYWFALVYTVVWHSLQSFTSAHCFPRKSQVFHISCIFSQTVSVYFHRLYQHQEAAQQFGCYSRFTYIFWATVKENERTHWLCVLWCMRYGQVQMQEWVEKKREAGKLGCPQGAGLENTAVAPLRSYPQTSCGSSCYIGVVSEVRRAAMWFTPWDLVMQYLPVNRKIQTRDHNVWCPSLPKNIVCHDHWTCKWLVYALNALCYYFKQPLVPSVD